MIRYSKPPTPKEITDLSKIRPDCISTMTVKKHGRPLVTIWYSEYHIQYYIHRGVSRMDAQAMLRSEVERRFAPRHTTFGVEIECYNVCVDEIINSARGRGLAMRKIRWYGRRDSYRYYNLVPDGSINGDRPIECVSPILDGSRGGFDSLKKCCDVMQELGAKVNQTTGLHVHVGGNISKKQYVNTFVNYYYLESVIDSFMAPSRHDNSYAKRLAGNVDDVVHACTVDQVNTAMHNDRYYKINCMSWSRHRTIEFRQHQGTTNYEEISNWVRFCINLVHWSVDNRLTAPICSIDAIPFLTGDEKSFFKKRADMFSYRDVA